MVPQEASIQAAGGRGSSGFGGEAGDLLSDEVLRVPELTDARVGNAGEVAAAGWLPVGGKNGLPYDQNPEIGIALTREQFLDRRNSAETERSSGGDEEQETRAGGRRVKRDDKVGNLRGVQGEKRRLARGGAAGHPQGSGSGDGDDSDACSEKHRSFAHGWTPAKR